MIEYADAANSDYHCQVVASGLALGPTKANRSNPVGCIARWNPIVVGNSQGVEVSEDDKSSPRRQMPPFSSPWSPQDYGFPLAKCGVLGTCDERTSPSWSKSQRGVQEAETTWIALTANLAQSQKEGQQVQAANAGLTRQMVKALPRAQLAIMMWQKTRVPLLNASPDIWKVLGEALRDQGRRGKAPIVEDAAA